MHLSDTQTTVLHRETGWLAWVHSVSAMWPFNIGDPTKCRSQVWVKMSRAGLSSDGEHQKRCWTLGALKEILSSIKASCASIRLSLSTSRAILAQRSVQVLIQNWPCGMSESLQLWSEMLRLEWQITLRLLGFSYSPSLPPSSTTRQISEATVYLWIASVRSSR